MPSRTRKSKTTKPSFHFDGADPLCCAVCGTADEELAPAHFGELVCGTCWEELGLDEDDAYDDDNDDVAQIIGRRYSLD